MRLKTWITCVAATGIAATLSACATAVPFDEGQDPYHLYLESFTGLSSDQLQSQWGAPDRIVTLSDGRKLWLYVKRRSQSTDGSNVSKEYTGVEGTYVGAGNKDVPSGSYMGPDHPAPESLTWETECDTRFVIGLDGKVQRSAFDGAGNGNDQGSSHAGDDHGCGPKDIPRK